MCLERKYYRASNVVCISAKLETKATPKPRGLIMGHIPSEVIWRGWRVLNFDSGLWGDITMKQSMLREGLGR